MTDTAGGLVAIVSIPHGGAAGNILRTGLVGRLLDAFATARIVIVSPMANDAAFVDEFTHPRITFEDLPPHRPTGLEARLLAFVQAGYLDSGVTESVRIRRAEALEKKTIRWIRAKRLLAGAIAPSLLRKESRYELSDRLVRHAWAERLFETYRPALLVTSSPGLIYAEVPLLRTAARRRVRSMAVDPSWDNFTNKLLPVRRVDRLIVWNDLMKAQAIELHGYQPDQVRVAGTPQWDLYFKPRRSGSREAFFRGVGADPSRKLVTLTTTPHELYSHHGHVLRVLVRAMEEGRWPSPAQILVRLHPRDDLSHYEPFARTPNVILEKPFRASVRAGDGLAVDITEGNQRHLADTLLHSDVVVNVASTIAIESAIFDTPVVNVAFDGDTPLPFARSARRYYRFTHYANITRQGAVRVAETPEDLVSHVGGYLADRSIDSDGRRRVVLEQCQFLDGQSAERAARFVVAELADASGIALDSSSCVASLASSR